MAKVTDQDRHQYFEKIKSYSTMTRTVTQAEKDILKEISGNAENAGMRKLELVNSMLDLTSYYIAINGVSQSVIKTKNEEALNDGRKALYKAVIYLEELVSNYIDAPFSDYDEKLSAIKDFDPNQRYHLVCKMGLALDLLIQAYGDNSKWKWTFVELEGRFATTAKNILDLRNIMMYKDFESPYYDSTIYHLRLVKELLSHAASRYRDKYELNTAAIPDFKMGISFLSALRRMHILLAENEDAEEIKKKLTIWKSKLDADQKKQEEAKKKV